MTAPRASAVNRPHVEPPRGFKAVRETRPLSDAELVSIGLPPRKADRFPPLTPAELDGGAVDGLVIAMVLVAAAAGFCAGMLVVIWGML